MRRSFSGKGLRLSVIDHRNAALAINEVADMHQQHDVPGHEEREAEHEAEEHVQRQHAETRRGIPRMRTQVGSRNNQADAGDYLDASAVFLEAVDERDPENQNHEHHDVPPQIVRNDVCSDRTHTCDNRRGKDQLSGNVHRPSPFFLRIVSIISYIFIKVNVPFSAPLRPI